MVTLTFPKGFNYSQLMIMADDGISSKWIPIKPRANKIVIRERFYDKYAAIEILLKKQTREHEYLNKTFFVTTKSAHIKVDDAKQNGASKAILRCNNCVDYIDSTAAALEKYSEEEAEVLNSFLRNNQSTTTDTSTAIRDSLERQFINKQLNFIAQHANDYYSFWLFRTSYAANPGIATDRLLTFFYTNFPDSFKQTIEGKEILHMLNGRIIKRGGLAPVFSVKDIAGNTINLASFRGKKVLLHFWASWCVPCIKELPQLKKIYQLYPADQLAIISITSDTEQLQFEKAVQKNELKWSQIFESATILHQYNVAAIPALFLIDEKGIIIYKRDDEPLEDESLSVIKQFLKTKE